MEDAAGDAAVAADGPAATTPAEIPPDPKGSGNMTCLRRRRPPRNQLAPQVLVLPPPSKTVTTTFN